MATIIINYDISSNVMGMMMLSWRCHKGLKQATCVLSLGTLPWCVDSEVHEVGEGVPKENESRQAWRPRASERASCVQRTSATTDSPRAASKQTAKEREREPNNTPWLHAVGKLGQGSAGPGFC